MPITKGRQTYLGIKRELVRGVAETVPAYYLAFKNLDANLKQEYVENDSAFGIRESLLDRYDTVRSAEGSAELILDADTIAYLLYYIYGQVSSVQDASTGAWTHTFGRILNNSECPTFTLFHSLGDAGHKSQNSCVLKDLEISLDEKGEGNVKTSWLALDENNLSAPNVALNKSTRPLLGKNLTAKFANSVSGLSSGTSFKISNVSVKFDTGAKYDQSYNTGINNAVLADGTTFEVSIKALVRSTDFYDRFKANTKTAFEIDLTALNLPLIGSSTTLRPRLNLTVAPSTVEVKFEKPLDDFVSCELTVKPEFSVSDNFSLRTIVQNSLSNTNILA